MKNEICSIVQIINDHPENAMIGNLYTKKAKRENGFAFSLLYTVTEGLIKNGRIKCGLLSDATNTTSNRIFQRIGYKPVYNWILLLKTKK